MSKPQRIISHVVQAWCTGLGWCDCRTASSEHEAEQLERELLAKDSAWMPDTRTRQTRIVPVDESRCGTGA